ncbi:MAG: response regulator [Acidobacteriota bacterium]|nr:response regulator [Acidobacteriota bacterium]
MALQVLVVEDDIASLELIREVLISMKADVEAFSKSRQAVPLLQEKRFDGIFLDLQMPGLNGFEFARLVRASSRNKATPIIIVTGREERETMGQAFEAGGTFYLQKPIDRYKLIALFRTTQGAMHDNRRRFARISLRTEVSCEGPGLAVKGESANLSCDGILFDSAGALGLKANVSLTFNLPAQRGPIRAQGLVVRVDDKGRAGVQFTSISARDKQRIQQLVDQEIGQ